MCMIFINVAAHTFWGICLKASRKMAVVSSGISDIMLPSVNTINP